MDESSETGPPAAHGPAAARAGTLTVSTRGLLVVALALAAALAAYVLGAAEGGGAPAQAAPTTAAGTQERARTLAMVGEGRATAVPDQMTFSLSVGLLRPDLATALDDASARTSRVLAALQRLGVRRSDVQTTGLSMSAVYDYHENAPPTVRGYRVSQRASVLVRELRLGGRAVSAAVAAGGDDVRVRDLRLRVGDVDGVLAQARAAAVDEARAKAEQYAAASGQDLGDVLTLREVGSRPRVTPQRVYDRGLRQSADLAATLPVRAGKDTSVVRVRVVWALG